mmetsp:Transcript_12360/g.23160  ORF Transcript_12360/g.23160 Transcript_12360/m.23160 type:complete len:371 (+) Transcript_12360:71-1183(+)
MSCFGSWEDILLSLCFSAKVSDNTVSSNNKKNTTSGQQGESSASTTDSDNTASNKNGSIFFLRRKKRKIVKFLCRPSKVDASGKGNTDTASSSCEDMKEIATANDLLELQRHFPESTLYERRRFLTSRSLSRATEKMDYYMKWRQQYHLDSPSFRSHPMFLNDLDSWKFAVTHASRHFQGGGGSSMKQFSGIKTLPRIVKFGDEESGQLFSSDGKRIAHVLPGLIDKDIAPLGFYALCVAIYMDLKFDRNSNEYIYVFIDVRAGKNWPNPSASSLIPFVKSLTKNLSDTMPERMCKTIVYPIPSYAKPIWVICKTFLDPRQVQKIDVIWGPALVDSSIPNEMNRKSFCGSDIIEKLEQSRQREFYPSDLQ